MRIGRLDVSTGWFWRWWIVGVCTGYSFEEGGFCFNIGLGPLRVFLTWLDAEMVEDQPQ